MGVITEVSMDDKLIANLIPLLRQSGLIAGDEGGGDADD